MRRSETDGYFSNDENCGTWLDSVKRTSDRFWNGWRERECLRPSRTLRTLRKSLADACDLDNVQYFICELGQFLIRWLSETLHDLNYLVCHPVKSVQLKVTHYTTSPLNLNVWRLVAFMLAVCLLVACYNSKTHGRKKWVFTDKGEFLCFQDWAFYDFMTEEVVTMWDGMTCTLAFVTQIACVILLYSMLKLDNRFILPVLVLQSYVLLHDVLRFIIDLLTVILRVDMASVGYFAANAMVNIAIDLLQYFVWYKYYVTLGNYICRCLRRQS